MEIFKAHRQWATRPPDERFKSLEDLEAATRSYAETAVEADVNWRDLRTVASGEDVQLVGKDSLPGTMTNWAFKQLAGRVHAPADYLSGLPVDLAVANLNHGLERRETNPGHKASLLLHSNGHYLVRAITTDIYSRIWNFEVASRLLDLSARGWEPAVPDMRTGPDPAPALYASDHDMFAMLRTANVELDINPSGNAPAWRGVIVENSEVGGGSLSLTRFLYNAMCGNHIIWGASELMNLRIVHVGQARDRMKQWDLVLKAYQDSSASDETAVIREAQHTRIADTKEGVLDKLFGIKAIALSRKNLDQGYEAVVPAQDGDPRTVWGMVQGITRHSQTIPFADKRNELDRGAGRILDQLQKVKF